jgi:hypothetical protein
MKTLNSLLNSLGLHVTSRSRFADLRAKEVENGHLHRLLTGVGTDLDVQFSPLENFNHLATLNLSKRRQEHLASLGLDLAGKTVLEVGAGIGDHTGFFLDRGCTVLCTDGRPANLVVLRERWLRQFGWYTNGHNLKTELLDLDNPPADFAGRFEVLYCYGVLYHLAQPLRALDFLARSCTSLLLLETSVSPARDERLTHDAQDPANVSRSIHGQGCHPSRPWVFHRLRERFEFVYVPATQPWHEEFPTDWTAYTLAPGTRRAVFVASRRELANPLLLEHLPDRQWRM